ncbi:glycosyltransferase [Winogradskyella sp.]|uniref:glycosyltransferase family 2 protein n=1 Tax=Winogradskyella sp. TaxID=1883156 RepID=UPI00260960DD|nr:glycosyltransferase [Winogradskyella sp.]
MISAIVIVIVIVYLVLIGSLIYGFDNVETFKLQDLEAKTKFSIVIPFRNEAKHLPRLLESILTLNYPKDLFEVIFVDDNSKDNSVKIIQEVLDTSRQKRDTRTDNINIIKNSRNSSSPKKDAVSSAIEASKYEWIITTDADCILPRYWLDTFDEYIQNQHPNCIVAPVTYTKNDSFFNRFQTLDFLSLQAATIGGFGLKQAFLCNGANFAYRKTVFKNINGFNGNSNIASGDDIFLLEKFKGLDAKKVTYLKSTEALVTTYPVDNFGQLMQQRLRWASKTTQNPNGFSKIIGSIVFLGNLVCIALPILFLLNLIEARITIALLVIKFAIDFLLLFKMTGFLKQESVLSSYIFSSVLYPCFSVYIASLSLFKPYYWKGRVFKK